MANQSNTAAASDKADKKSKKSKDKQPAAAQPTKLSGPARTAANKARRIAKAQAQAKADATKQVVHGLERQSTRAVEQALKKERDIIRAEKQKQREEKTQTFMNKYYPKFMAGEGQYLTMPELCKLQGTLLWLFEESKKPGSKITPVQDKEWLSSLFVWADSNQPDYWNELDNRIAARREALYEQMAS